MSGMVERVARAIYDEGMRESAFNDLMGNFTGYDEENPTAKEIYRQIARAAIEAMREPTDVMRRDGWHELRKHNDIQTRLGNSLVGVETPTYQAMIDAALK
jgi:hypothetical protein